MQQADYQTEVFTGIRPTSDLTVANYLGAVLPVLEFQRQGLQTVVFVADLHALTDKEPDVVRAHIQGVVADYIALGLDPDKVTIYRQSDIMGEVASLTTILARHITVAELMRVPTLKDKIKTGNGPETANALLLLYPVMMAADILINRAQKVPVGEDQIVHIEVTRRLAEKFNKQYGPVLPPPEALTIKSLRIMSLKGDGKMSKSIPQGALFLTDDMATIAKKIKSAETAVEGEMTDRLQSHILIAKGLATTDEQRANIDAIITQHQQGQAVMGDFKSLFTTIAQEFLGDFQAKRAEITARPDYIADILDHGATHAKKIASQTLADVMQALQIK